MRACVRAHVCVFQVNDTQITSFICQVNISLKVLKKMFLSCYILLIKNQRFEFFRIL